jgi:GntR family transcriptional repressor for pyruvate dehydrogenase complex
MEGLREVRPFDPVRTQRTFQEICEQIRAGVTSGALRPGDKLPTEREMAREFGVSRTAVREALRSLEVAGMVQLLKGAKGGAYIQKGGPEALTQSIGDMLSLGTISLESLTEARILISDSVVRLACKRGTNADFAAIERNIALTEKLSQAGPSSERTESVVAFYRLVAAAAHNEVLSILVEAATDIVRGLLAHLAPPPRADLVQRRRRFLKHLRDRDADRAAKEMTSYLKRLHRQVLKPEQERRLRQGYARQ